MNENRLATGPLKPHKLLSIPRKDTWKFQIHAAVTMDHIYQLIHNVVQPMIDTSIKPFLLELTCWFGKTHQFLTSYLPLLRTILLLMLLCEAQAALLAAQLVTSSWWNSLIIEGDTLILILTINNLLVHKLELF